MGVSGWVRHFISWFISTAPSPPRLRPSPYKSWEQPTELTLHRASEDITSLSLLLSASSPVFFRVPALPEEDPKRVETLRAPAHTHIGHK